jgi:hypothetical protein
MGAGGAGVSVGVLVLVEERVVGVGLGEAGKSSDKRFDKSIDLINQIGTLSGLDLSRPIKEGAICGDG